MCQKKGVAFYIPGIHSTICRCRNVHLAQTGWSIKTRVKEPHYHSWLFQAGRECSHSTTIHWPESLYHVQWHTHIPAEKSRCRTKLIGEARGIEVNSNSMRERMGSLWAGHTILLFTPWRKGLLIRVKWTIWCLTLYKTTKTVIRVNRSATGSR